MKVTLRQRKKGNKISLYLDYYHKGKREYEYLQLYLTPKPEKGTLTKAQRTLNKETLDLAESICAKRQLDIKSGIYGFEQQVKLKGSFLKYFENLTEKRRNSEGNYGNWLSVLKHLKHFAPNDVNFSQINAQWLEKFKEYLMNDAKTSSDNLLSVNSQSSYFNKVRAALKQARREGIIIKNPAEEVTGIKPGDSVREFLTLEELQAAAKAECEIPQLKSAFLFSCLTGLRWSDIKKLTWSEIQNSKELGWYIRFQQQKTKAAETLPISDQAYELLGKPGPGNQKIFLSLKYSAWHNLKIKQWLLNAEIKKNITFHCARHTYATLQLTLGTDIYTVSKLLGHKNLKTTQVYAKIIDEKKKEAANKINLKF